MLVSPTSVLLTQENRTLGTAVARRLWVSRGRGGLRRISLANVAAVERLLRGERGGRVAELPGGARVERRKGLLTFYVEGGR